ncbi:MAG: S9 family peptidase [Pyramidobacter porci]|uniref:S9 family peptidase n=1 Tax=Pyramidobacter porci TaxID=2605789 RepID=UPI002A760826|nr:S9 family peptidase [Pyramidobacter porci]MDY2649375.1 S9 family peptidase [Pyramidobacter porci]
MTEKKTVQFDDLLHFKFLSCPRLSPDGALAVYQVAQADLEKDGYDTNLWLYDCGAGRSRQVTFSNADKTARWTPDGKALVFTSKRDATLEKDATALYRLELGGGEARRLGVVPLPVNDLWPLADGKILLNAVYTPEESNPENAQYKVYTQIPFWQNGKNFTGQRRSALALWDPRSGELRRLTPDRMDVLDCTLPPCGGAALLVAEEYEKVKPLCNHVWRLDLESGAMDRLSEGLEYSFKTAGWSGERIIVLASDMKRYGMNENAQVFELKDKKLTCLTPDLDTSFHNSMVGDCRYGVETQYGLIDDDGLYYISTQGASSQIHFNDLNGHDRSLTPGLLSADCFDVRGGRILAVGFRGLQLQELYVTKNDGETQLTHHNDSFMAQFQLSQPEHYTVDNGEGLTIDCWYMKPVGAEPGKKYPTIFDIHGGPKATYGALYFHEAQCWAALGYTVIFCNPRGSDGRGNEFADIRGFYGVKDYQDFNAMLDWAVTHFDFIDAERLGVTGGSYGGYMTNWMISHSDRFKCAASQRGICNWISFDGVSDIGWYFGVDQQGGSGPLTDLEGAWKASPLKYVGNVKTPTLFIHSAEDRRCPDEQAFQFYTALQVLGVEVRLCYFLGENHELSRSGKPRSRLARLREITDWMDRFLKK